MRKAQVFLEEKQLADLKRVAKATGRKQSEIIRRGVDLAVIEAEAAGADDWRAATRGAAGMWTDHAEIDAMRDDLRARYSERLDVLFPDPR